MTTTERNLQDVRVIFADGPAITVPGVWQIRSETTRLAVITFLAGGGASVVVFAGERVQLAAHCLEPGLPYYYTLTLSDAPISLGEAMTQMQEDQHAQ